MRLPEVSPPLAWLLSPAVSVCYQLRAPVGGFVGRGPESEICANHMAQNEDPQRMSSGRYVRNCPAATEKDCDTWGAAW